MTKLLEYKRKFNTFHCMIGRAAAGKMIWGGGGGGKATVKITAKKQDP